MITTLGKEKYMHIAIHKMLNQYSNVNTTVFQVIRKMKMRIQ